MDQKTWRWRKRFSEKTIVANDKPDISPEGDEDAMIPTEKEVALEISVKKLNEKLASMLHECNAKDDLVAQHLKMVQEANAGRKKAEAEVMSLKQEFDEVSRQRVASNEQLAQLNAALKETMLQLNSVREEHEQRIHDSVMKTSIEFEKAQRKLEEKYTETSKRVTSLTAENTQLSKALLMKEKIIEDLSKRKSHAEADFNTLMARLDSVEKENAFLKYEFHMVEKELEVRNEERELNHQYVNASHKQYLESEKKIAKLEAECQRLRVLVRKRGGPNAFAKTKNEVEFRGRNQMEMRNRKMDPVTGGLVVRDATIETEIPSKKISFLIDRLCNVEEENKILKEILAKKDDELQSLRITCSRTTSRLPSSDLSNSDKSCSRSWDSVLTSELEHFRHAEPKNSPECKIIGVSDMSLMDDFAEMEKLAIVSIDSPFTSDTSHELTGKELVPMAQVGSGDASAGEPRDWLHRVVEVILDQNRVSNRSLNELLEDIRVALTSMSSSSASESLPISGYITWKSPNSSPRMNTFDRVSSVDMSAENTSNEHISPNLSGSIFKIIKLIEEIDRWSGGDLSILKTMSSTTLKEYYVRVFRWRSCELRSVLEHFIYTCNDLSKGKASLEQFAGELASALDWVINNCISSQECPSLTGKIKNHFESEQCEEKYSCSPLDASTNTQDAAFKMEKIQTKLQEENRKLKNELKNMESSLKDLEVRLKSANDTSKALMNQLHVSEQSIGSLKTELETLKESKGMIEDQIENQKLINEDLDTQLNVSRVKLHEVLQKILSLQVELEDKNHCCEELEAICLELQLQLESVASKGIPKENTGQEEKLLHTGWEISAASAKLAECQETIIDLGKQLKALTSPKESAILDKVFSAAATTTTTTTTTAAANNRTLVPRPSLRDRMLAEDKAKADDKIPPKTTEITSHAETKAASDLCSENCDIVCARSNALVATPEAYLGLKHVARTPGVGALAIVPSKKRGGGGGFLRKLLMRRKRGSCKKTSLFIAI